MLIKKKFCFYFLLFIWNTYGQVSNVTIDQLDFKKIKTAKERFFYLNGNFNKLNEEETTNTKNYLKKINQTSKNKNPYDSLIISELLFKEGLIPEAKKIGEELLKSHINTEEINCYILDQLLRINKTIPNSPEELLYIVILKLEYCDDTEYKLHDVYSHMGLQGLAKKYYRNANKNKLNNHYLTGRYYYNLAIFNFREGELDSSLYYIEKGKKHLDQTIQKDPTNKDTQLWISIGLNLENLISIENNEYDKAYNILSKKIPIENIDWKNPQKEKYNIEYTIRYLRILPNINKKEKLKYLYTNILTQYKYNLDLSMSKRKEILKALISYHESTSEPDSIIFYLKELQKTEKNIRSTETAKINSAFNKLDDFQNNIFKKIVKEKDKKADSYLKSIIVSSTLLIIFILVLIIYRNKNKLIRKQKNIIESNLNQKITLLHEVDHRVKNNLQLIKSLLNLQLKNLNQENAVAAFKDTMNRIQTISKVHKELFNTDDDVTISLDKYLNNIVRDLIIFYGSDNQIKTTIKISPNLKIKTDEKISLGLIINELITNSLKYAFTKSKNNTIEIHIKENEEYIQFQYNDNGSGFNPLLIRSKKTIGLNLVERLSNQLGSKLSIQSKKGVTIEFKFKKSN